MSAPNLANAARIQAAWQVIAARTSAIARRAYERGDFAAARDYQAQAQHEYHYALYGWGR